MAARTTTTKEKQLKQPQANYNNTVEIQYYRNAITAKVRKKTKVRVKMKIPMRAIMKIMLIVRLY